MIYVNNKTKIRYEKVGLYTTIDNYNIVILVDKNGTLKSVIDYRINEDYSLESKMNYLKIKIEGIDE